MRSLFQEVNLGISCNKDEYLCNKTGVSVSCEGNTQCGSLARSLGAASAAKIGIHPCVNISYINWGISYLAVLKQFSYRTQREQRNPRKDN